MQLSCVAMTTILMERDHLGARAELVAKLCRSRWQAAHLVGEWRISDVSVAVVYGGVAHDASAE